MILHILYDYDRLPKRELHIEDSLNVIDFNQTSSIVHFGFDNKDSNEYFDFLVKTVNGEYECDAINIEIIYIISGSGIINGNNVKENDCILLLKENKINVSGKLVFAKSTPKRG